MTVDSSWLVLDIGNSAVKGGLYAGDRLIHTFRTSHEAEPLESHISGALQTASIARAGLASVVPSTAAAAMQLLEKAGVPLTRVRPTMRLPFELGYRTPDTLGADRLAAAAAAWIRFGEPMHRGVVALDAGSAFTYEVVDRSGVYRGGTIAPGPGLMQRALHLETAQLPEVPLVIPDEPIGRSTIEAIQVGVMYGFIESARGLLRRINEALGEETYVVVTGGWAPVLAEHVDLVDAVEPHLVLEGVRLLMQINDE